MRCQISQTSILVAPQVGHSVRVSASGRFPRAEGQGGTVKGRVDFLAKLSLFNFTGMIFAFLAESLPKACNTHHLLTIYRKSGLGKT